MTTRTYGRSPEQYVEIGGPSDERSPRGTTVDTRVMGTAVLVHGGYWRAEHALDHMRPLAADLRSRGWTVVNVEYRRGGSGGGWPDTRDDVRAARRLVSEVRGQPPSLPSAADDVGFGDPGPVVVIGHSVGGWLALLSAAPADAVVALAPVTDLVRTDAERLGEDAVHEFLGCRPSAEPERWVDASPIKCPRVEGRTLIVHGDADTRVPVEHSRDYVAQVLEQGADVEYREVPGLDHFRIIDPASAHWPGVTAWMDEVSATTS